MNYYNMSGIPDIVWDGVVRQVGSGGGDVNGVSFAAIINDRLSVDAPLAVSVMSYSFVGDDPYITVKIEVFEDLGSNANTYLRVGICENGLSFEGTDYHNVLRDMPTDTPLTIMNVGEIQEVTIPVPMNGQWDPSELWAFAFVQRDSDHLIYNSGSTYITPYTLDVAVDGAQQAIIDAPYTFGLTTVTNIGLAAEHTVDINMDTSSLPEGWDAYFTLGGVDMTTTTMTMEQYDTAELVVTMVPGGGDGSGRAVLNVHSHSGEMDDINVPFVGIIAGSDLLIVSDDGGAGYAYDYFGPAIGTTTKTSAVWERALGGVTAELLEPYEVVIWQTGNRYTSLDADDRAAIQAYMGAGGRVFLSGEHLVEGIFAEAGTWLQFFLRVAYQSGVPGGPDVTGVADDPISDGLVLDLIGGDGAGNYGDPDVIEPVNGGGGVQCFSYDINKGAGVWVEYGNTKVVTFGFGFESINAVADRDLLMQQILQYLAPVPSGVDSGSGLPQMVTLSQNVPNPFNPQTKISFNLDRQSQVHLAVYDVTGRLVRVLANEVRSAGEHTMIWDGRDTAGGQVASGTYFYRLTSPDNTFSRKMTMLK